VLISAGILEAGVAWRDPIQVAHVSSEMADRRLEDNERGVSERTGKTDAVFRLRFPARQAAGGCGSTGPRITSRDLILKTPNIDNRHGG
jgi:hypothetical protein